MLKIVKTYRNAQEIIDVAGNFIQRNDTQISKRLISPKSIVDPILIYTYDSTFKGKDGNRRSGANYAMAHAVETALEQLLVYKQKEHKEPGPILLLGRFGFDGEMLERSGLFEYISRGYKVKSVKYPKLDITFMTVHSSKGLGYDDVIILNGKNETYGFPSKIEDDPVLAFVIRGDRSIDYAEERRLFYVAMTRTKNRVFMIAPEQNPSEFLLEIKRDYKNVVLKGNWNENSIATKLKKVCPLCGYPMQLKYKSAYGLKLYICTNEPEVCGFMTNDYRAGKMSIQKCDRCRDGYLVVKKGKNSDFILGCTNYKADGTGCDRTINKKYFYNQMGYKWDEKEIEPSPSETVVAVQQKNEKQQISSPVTENDYVAVVYANLPPVMYRGYNLNHVIFTIIKAQQNVSQIRFYGITVLTEVLKGANDKKIIDNKLNQIPEFGAMQNMSFETIRSIIEWMISEHLLLKTKGKYPVLHSTYEGLHYSEFVTGEKLEILKKYLEEVLLWEPSI